MRLSDLVPDHKSKHDPVIAGLSADSRAVEKDWLFAALPGSRLDGRHYIEDAVRNGASVILSLPGTDVPDGVILIADDNPRKVLAQMAARFYGAQPDYIAAVTGTNGKTSTVDFAQQIWRLLDVKAVSLGTLGVRGGGMVRAASMTTPDAVALQATLADLKGSGINHVAMEASSHGLDQHRLDGVKVCAAGFTSFSQDHLDYHGTMEHYLAAKVRLFDDLLAADGTAVLNADIPEFETLRQNRPHVIDFGHKAQAIKITAHKASPKGQALSLSVLGQDFELILPLVGGFQVMNALCALGLVIAEKQDDAAFVKEAVLALEQLKGVPGRLEFIGEKNGAAVYIDYAHTPDALDHVLEALRPHTQNHLHCLIGCGGNRDTGKRPLMGRIAAEKADKAIITDDNPRHEDPAEIRAAMITGLPDELKSKITEIDGRAAAIVAAIKALKPGDVLVIAGKGHEQGQLIGDETIPFDDAQEARQSILTLSQGDL